MLCGIFIVVKIRIFRKIPKTSWQLLTDMKLLLLPSNSAFSTLQGICRQLPTPASVLCGFITAPGGTHLQGIARVTVRPSMLEISTITLAGVILTVLWWNGCNMEPGNMVPRHG